MSYRFEGEDLVFDGWERGIADSPYQIISPSALGPVNQTGTVDLSYGNILGIPGEFSVEFPLAPSTIVTSGGSAMGIPLQKTTKYNIQSGTIAWYYLLDSKGQIFLSSISGNTVTWTYQGTVGAPGINNTGLVFWQNFLFTFKDDKIFYSADNGVTNTDWTGTVGSLFVGYHYAISSKVSDTLYFCNGSSVGSIILVPGKTFSPTDPTSYTFSLAAVNIPLYDTTVCLGELNGQIIIGGALERVYPWDANNLSGSGITSLVGLPLFLGDRYVQRIVVVNTNAYIFTGVGVQANSSFTPCGLGNIYISNGTNLDIFKKMPDNFVTIGGTVSQVQQPYWIFGDAIFHRNKLMFGAYAIDNITGSVITDTGGVWAIDLNSQALYRACYVASDGNNQTTSSPVSIINPLETGTRIPGLGIFVGSYKSTTGAMVNSTSALNVQGIGPTGATAARAITDKVPVGTFLNKKTYEQVELKTAVALASGESIDVLIYSDLNPGGLAVGSMTSTDGMSKVFTPVNFQNLQWFQIQTTLNPTNTNPTFVRLREIRVR